MNKQFLVAFLLVMCFAVALGVAVTPHTAMAYPGYGDYREHDNNDEYGHYNSSDYEHDGDYNYMHDNGFGELKDCFGYFHGGHDKKGYGHDNDYDKEGYAHDKKGYGYDKEGYDLDNDYDKEGYSHDNDYRHYNKSDDSHYMFEPYWTEKYWFEKNWMDEHCYDMFYMDDYHMWYDVPGTITVTGSAMSSVDPERVVISMGVETTKPTAGEALSENSRMLSSAITSITSLGISIDNITTSHISIHPEYDGYYDDFGRYSSDFIGYTVSNIVMVDTDRMDMAGDILDSAVQAGVNRVNSIDFTLSEETNIMVRESLIEHAVLNAKHQANLALEPLHHEIVGVESIIVHSDGFAPSLEQFATDFAEKAFAAVSAPILEPSQDLSMAVTVTFLIGPDYSLYLDHE